ncbi:MAG: hypothetical protein ACP5MD_10635 [Verrucomicrobiia bacterium]
MAIYLQNAQGPVYLNGQAVAGPGRIDLRWADCVATGSGGSVTICSDGAVAASVSGLGSNVQPYVPPVQQVLMLYYRYSYRWQVQTPGGSVGIRA